MDLPVPVTIRPGENIQIKGLHHVTSSGSVTAMSTQIQPFVHHTTVRYTLCTLFTTYTTLEISVKTLLVQGFSVMFTNKDMRLMVPLIFYSGVCMLYGVCVVWCVCLCVHVCENNSISGLWMHAQLHSLLPHSCTYFPHILALPLNITMDTYPHTTTHHIHSPYTHKKKPTSHLQTCAHSRKMEESI